MEAVKILEHTDHNLSNLLSGSLTIFRHCRNLNSVYKFGMSLINEDLFLRGLCSGMLDRIVWQEFVSVCVV
jgi:hypothetical protein